MEIKMKPVTLFATDLDGALLGNASSAQRFAQLWLELPIETRPLLVYNSGRTIDDLCTLQVRTGLPPADYMIGGGGTQLWCSATKTMVKEFPPSFSQGWDADLVEEILKSVPGMIRQAAESLHPYKPAWFLYGAGKQQITDLRKLFASRNLDVIVQYTSGCEVEVLPAQTDKGKALAWLCEYLGISLREVVVAGDSGNDTPMFWLPGVRGIVVENAQPELLEAVISRSVYMATDILADGVIQGLKYYHVLPDSPPQPSDSYPVPDSEKQLNLGPDTLPQLTLDELELVATGYAKALETIRKCISPLGFLAASLEDNETTGTDVNYRSVWSRDGCITLINTILIEDQDIRNAAKATLETILSHTTEIGQVPSNIRIDSGEPDYSGVGGISSVDSGLWLIIGAYHYVRVTGDMDFLCRHLDTLQKVMNWLAGLDSNNNGMLEIPEAGDWTDLFGRSYNILYDEVLWFRANVCFGRLLAFRGRMLQAAETLRRSQKIRHTVLGAFWPSTHREPDAPQISFADRQFSLGDTQYLLAQVSPFGFDWRCDVLGNILASLMNLIDHPRAMKTFRFLWGVGVNAPFPVSNLYPPVWSGDPDWKSYYLVNLLNLPHHYHNGGIWPFIGAMWVRFICRLGMKEVAARELVNLALVNREGSQSEWEFNEWVHGTTGRPMGKRFQAWSAACFIRACQELHLDSPTTSWI